MALEDQVADLVAASNNLTSEVNGKISQIDQKVNQATSEVTEKIRQQFDVTFYVDAESGSDSNDGLTSSRPLATINSAVSSSRSPSGARIRVEMLGDVVVEQIISFSNKHVFIQTNGHDLTLSAFDVSDSNGNNVGTGLRRIQGRGQNSSLVIKGGRLLMGDCVSTGNGDQWFWRNYRTAIQMGGIDYDSGFFPVVLNAVEVIVGGNVVFLASGSNGTNVYAGQGVVCSTLYLATIDVSAEGAVAYGYGVHFRNNSVFDANGNKMVVEA